MLVDLWCCLAGSFGELLTEKTPNCFPKWQEGEGEGSAQREAGEAGPALEGRRTRWGGRRMGGGEEGRAGVRRRRKDGAGGWGTEDRRGGWEKGEDGRGKGQREAGVGAGRAEAGREVRLGGLQTQVRLRESSAHVLRAELSGRVRPGGCCGSGRPLAAEPERAGRRPRVGGAGLRCPPGCRGRLERGRGPAFGC